MRLETSFGAVGLVVMLTFADSEWNGQVAPAEQMSAPKPGACRSSVDLVESINTYEFFGARADAAGSSLRQRLLVSTDYAGREKRFTGQTDWHIEWRPCFEVESGRCRIGGVASTVNVTYTLPKWVDRDAAPPHLRERWRRYIDGLATHEKGHGEIAREVAWQIEAALVGRVSSGGCELLNAESVPVVEEVMNRGEAMQRAYDRRTEHGGTQGASFPF